MRKITKITLAAGFAVLLSLGAKNSFAHFEGGSEDSGTGSGGSCTDYNAGTNWCSRFRAWYYYEYDESIDYGAVTVKATNAGISNWHGFDRATSITVSDQCDNHSSGFYVSGIVLWDDTMGGKESPVDDVYRIGTTSYGTYYNGHWIGAAKYSTTSPDKYLQTEYTIDYRPLDNQGHYIKSTKTVAPSVVENAWNDYGRDYAKQQDPSNSDNLSSYSWFCAGDKNKKQEQYYKGDAFIRLSENSSADLSVANSDDLLTCSSNTGDCNGMVSGSGTKKIYYMAAGKVTKDESMPISSGYEEFDGTKFALANSNTSGGSAIAGTKAEKNGNIYDISRHLNFDPSASKNAGYIEIAPGEKKVICAINDYYSHYKDGKYDDGTERAWTCITLNYDTSVAAIDSETTLTLTDRTGGAYSQSSGIDNSGNISYGEVDYGYQSLRAEWNFNLSSSDRCLESKFDGKNCTEGYGTNSSFNVAYKRNGAIFNDSDSLTTTLSSGNGYKSALDSVTKNYNLLPGETINSDDSKEGVSHLSGVHTDGSKANKAQDESSSMSFEVKARDIDCGINNQPIGLGHPDNYGRMSVVTNDISRQVAVGDGASAMDNKSNPLWLKETDSVTINYEACIGEQIKKDKESGASDWNATISDNAILGVQTTDDLLDSTHYSGTSNAIDESSTSGKNIAADEVIGDTITSHIAQGYQFTGPDSVSTHNAQIGNVGHKIFNDYKISSSKTATAQINIPYNYILRPEITTGSADILTIGDNVAFELSIEKKGRENTKLGGEYKTNSIKPDTRAKYLTFKLSTGTSFEEFQNKADTFATIDGDQTNNLEAILSSNYNIQADSAVDISFDEIANGTKISKNWDNNSASDDYNKLCVAVAVYPADSHNSRESKIDTGNQDNALMQGAGDGAFTRIAVSCKTVGKYPTVSVEGNGVIAKGSVNGHSTRYSGRDFGSWSEYGLVANNVNSFASGASLAYMNAQTNKNSSVNPADAGKKKEQMDAPQTFGNMNSSNVGLNNEGEAATYYSTAKAFAEAVKASFFSDAPDGNSAIVERSASSVKTYVNTNYGSNVTIDASKAAEINSRTDGQVIIYSRGDIKISNSVEELNAILIADGKVDTCAEADQGSNGNKDLLDNCYNPLVVNGAVYSENSIALDRVYGGGSERDMNLNGDNLARRAEIFNYDPASVAWSYSFTNHSQALITTYIQEISTRY